MKFVIVTAAAALFGVGLLRAADIKLCRDTVATFVAADQGAQILAAKDEFIQRLSPFDRSARMKTDKEVSEKEFLQFVKVNVGSWTDAEKQTVEAAIARVRSGLESFPLSLPKTVYLVKTTGAEEGKAFYTRDTALVFPQGRLAGAENSLLEKTICHELFHVFSRTNPKVREQLYEAIGFQKCAEVEFPAYLKSRKITNPDAPKNDHYIRLQYAGEQIQAVPILFSKTEKYDTSRGGEFFNYLEFQFLVLPSEAPSLTKAASAAAGARLVAPQEVSGFFELVGRNTDYVIHPEEILAENFAMLITGKGDVRSPEILEKIRAILNRD